MSSFLRNRGRLFHVVCRGRTNKTPTRPTTTPTPTTTTTTTTTTTIKNEIQYTERGGETTQTIIQMFDELDEREQTATEIRGEGRRREALCAVQWHS